MYLHLYSIIYAQICIRYLSNITCASEIQTYSEQQEIRFFTITYIIKKGVQKHCHWKLDYY